MRSLGTLNYPRVEVVESNMTHCFVTLKVSTEERFVKLKMGVNCVRQLVDLSHEIVELFHEWLKHRQNSYERLRDYTNYKEKS